MHSSARLKKTKHLKRRQSPLWLTRSVTAHPFQRALVVNRPDSSAFTKPDAQVTNWKQLPPCPTTAGEARGLARKVCCRVVGRTNWVSTVQRWTGGTQCVHRTYARARSEGAEEVTCNYSSRAPGDWAISLMKGMTRHARPMLTDTRHPPQGPGDHKALYNVCLTGGPASVVLPMLTSRDGIGIGEDVV